MCWLKKTETLPVQHVSIGGLAEAETHVYECAGFIFVCEIG